MAIKNLWFPGGEEIRQEKEIIRLEEENRWWVRDEEKNEAQDSKALYPQPFGGIS